MSSYIPFSCSTKNQRGLLAFLLLHGGEGDSLNEPHTNWLDNAFINLTFRLTGNSLIHKKKNLEFMFE